MIIKKEISLENFDFWSGARRLAETLTSEEFYIIEELLEEVYPDGAEEVEINDFFWFDGDTIAKALGYEDEDELLKRGVDIVTINGTPPLTRQAKQ